MWGRATAGKVTLQKRQIQQGLLDGCVTLADVSDVSDATCGELASLLVLRVRPGLSLRFILAAGILAEGCTSRNRVDAQMNGILLPTGPDGAEQEWSVFAVGLEGLVDHFFGPEPGAGPAPAEAPRPARGSDTQAPLDAGAPLSSVRHGSLRPLHT